MNWPAPHTPERQEIKEVLHRFIEDLSKDQRNTGSLLIRKDDFQALFGSTTDPDFQNIGYKFGSLPLVVTHNPVRRIEYVDFRED